MVERAFVVTGASSGIGRACALDLARRGHRVLAGVRRDADAEALRAAGGANVEPVKLDVADAASIAAATAVVAERLGERGLDGLVNNAGIGVAAPMEHVPIDVVRRHFEVNVFGQIAVTQALLPWIRRAGGRVVNMGSVGGHVTIPFGGVLCGSKSAFHAISDAMRLELHPFGVHVCTIEPGAIRTPAVDKTIGDADAIVSALPAEGARRYGALLRGFLERANARERDGSPPEVVAEAVHHALTSPRPRTRYPVGKDAIALVTLPRVLPDRLLDRVRLRLFGIPTVFGALRDR